MSQPIETTVQNAQSAIIKTVKNRIYDFIAAIIIIAVIALSLGVIERRVITVDEILDLLVECIPMFLAAMLLTVNFYNKGVFYGKQTQIFVKTSKTYSSLVSSFTGEEIRHIPMFCTMYNDEVLRRMQTDMLKVEGLSYEMFSETWKDADDKEHKALICMSSGELKNCLNEDQVKIVKKTKRVKIKGILVNILLGTNTSDDVTDVGYSEEQLRKRRTWTSAVMFSLSVIVMSLIAVKNVTQWGWFGIALVLFKVMYIFCRSYMSYFNGYNDITIHLVNSTNRKIDILKECKSWMYTNFTDVQKGNNFDNNI